MSWEFETTLSASTNSNQPTTYKTCLNGDYKYKFGPEIVNDVTTHHIRFYSLSGDWNEVFDIVHPYAITSVAISKNGKSIAVYDKHTVSAVTTRQITVYTNLTTNWLDKVETFTVTADVLQLAMSADGFTIVYAAGSSLTTYKYSTEWLIQQPIPISPLSFSLSGDGTTLVARLNQADVYVYDFGVDEPQTWKMVSVLVPVDVQGDLMELSGVTGAFVREDGNAAFLVSSDEDIGSRAFGRLHHSFIPHTIPTEANVSKGTLLWSGRDCWAFRATGAVVQPFTINPWEPANVVKTGADTITESDQAEKLSHHFYFDNEAFPVMTRGCEASELSNTWDFRGLSAAVHGNSILVCHNIDILRWDTETRTYCGLVTTLPTVQKSTVIHCEGTFPEYEQLTPHSNICVVKDKLFVATKQMTDSSQNRLAVYDLVAKTWSTVVLPGKQMSVDGRHIVYGLENHIWITSKNDHSIVKVNVDTLLVTSSVRINRHPYRLSVNQSKELFIASDANPDPVLRKDFTPELASGVVSVGGGYVPAGQAAFKIVETVDTTDGQISVLDQTDDSQEAFGAARCNGTKTQQGYTINNDFFDDGSGYMWFLTDEHIGRMKKVDKEYWTSFTATDSGEAANPDYNMIPDNSTLVEAVGAVATLVSPPLVYERWNGSTFVTTYVKPYLFALQSSGLVKVRRLSALVRKNKYIHRGTAMIAVGDQAYYGD